MIRNLLAALLLCAVSCMNPAFAHRRHHAHVYAQQACEGLFCLFSAVPVKASGVAAHSSQIIGGRPAGCPHAFCGCGASLHLFGRIIPSLNLAANWLRFPKASPAPKMAAVRQHHVFVLEADLGGGVWEVYDANSGGGRVRLHPRSIAGYQIVNPTGGA